jgi:hypothetical protein
VSRFMCARLLDAAGGVTKRDAERAKNMSTVIEAKTSTQAGRQSRVVCRRISRRGL